MSMAQAQKEQDPLAERGKKRQARIAAAHSFKPKSIRVEPKDDAMRRLLKHPKAGRFRSSGSAEWPDDKYTQKRLREGSVTRAEDKKQSAHTPTHSAS
jgi:hypothetical protein